MWIDSWAGSPRPRSRRAAVSLTRLTITRTNVWSHLLNSLHLTTKRLSSSTTNKHARVISPVHWEYYLLLQAYNQNIPSKFSVISWFITCDICSPHNMNMLSYHYLFVDVYSFRSCRNRIKIRLKLCKGKDSWRSCVVVSLTPGRVRLSR